MEQQGQQQGGVPGPAGRRLHIAHRRSPSEMTPMIMEQLALQQQIEFLQQQQQHIAATHQQYVNMGMIPQQQQLPNMNYPNQQQGQQGQQGMAFQFPQQQQPMGSPGMAQASNQQPAHRRNQSALPNMSMGPPPAPSSGAAGQGGYDYSQSGNPQARDGQSHRGGRGGGQAGGGHQRRHSLALPEAKKAAELAQQKRGGPGFQFPIPGAGGASPGSANNTPLSPVEAEKSPNEAMQPPTGLSQRSGNIRGGSGHGRSQSMAVGNGRGGGQGRGGNPTFQFPPPMATPDGGASAERRGSASGGHARTGSRNFEGNWRQPNNNQQGPGQEQQAQQQQAPQQQASQQQAQQQPMGSFQSQNPNPAAPNFQPGHRNRASVNQSMGSIGSFQFPNQGQMMQTQQGQMMVPQMFAGQPFGPMQLNQLQALQAAQLSGQSFPGLGASQHAQPQMGMQQQNQQQQRKTLFTPYLPQASLPALLGDGQLVSGILRVNKKNRSDAYVTSTDLDADIFICGSKDRNRALEGDFVAIELLDVDEVWGQKREKEEKKKRKDITDSRISNSTSNDKKDGGDSAPAEGGLRRRGSLRQRPTQKKNDDVEVEGQSLLLMEEEEISDEQKPLFAGHVVAVIDRIAGQMFSGTLGLLRPSSQATKEKQEAERQTRGDGPGRHQDRQQEKPKIVWFKPTDKRVPLIAIPTEQAPRDFVERHQDYANRIFVACIKRWPITSLHPFGTLVEQLGEMGDLKVETDALLRDNNFGPDEFSDAVLKNIGFEEWSIENESEDAIAARRDFRGEKTFTIDPTGSEDLDDAIHLKHVEGDILELGVHVSDAAHFIKPNSLVDREAKKRGTGVHLVNRIVKMLPPRLSTELCSLLPGQARYTVSVVFQVNTKTGQVLPDQTWIGKSIINSSGRLTYDEVDAVIAGKDIQLHGATTQDIQTLQTIAQKFREVRFESNTASVPSLRLLAQLDDENVPVEHNIFESTPAHVIIEELGMKANAFVAEKIATALPDKALLRRHALPKHGRLQTFAERMTKVGYAIDTSSSATLQTSLFKVPDTNMRKGMETLLVKTMQRAKYVIAGKTPQEQWPHFAFNLPVYTHFTNPSRRYADVVVHRQLEVALSNGATDFNEDMDNLVKTIDQCNTKKDSAQSAQEQSVHIDSCRLMDKKRQKLGGDLVSEGIIICVYESAFDVLIPEYGFEKRVHCDQLPLKKAEFRKETRVLELYWEKGVTSSAFVPEDERPKAGGRGGGGGGAAAAQHPSRAQEEAQRKQMDTGTMSTDDVDALFDDDDDGVSEVNEMTSGVSLNATDRDTQSMPHSPTRGGPDDLHRTQSESNFSRNPEAKLTDKQKYLKMFKLREEGGEYIQDVTEMTRVPVILKTDLTKSPPCLTIRTMNPYAL